MPIPLNYTVHQSQYYMAGQTIRFTSKLYDDAGLLLSRGKVLTMSLSLFHKSADGLILVPGFVVRDVKGVNGGSFSPESVFSLVLSQADTILADPTNRVETHRCVVSYTWASGADALIIDFVLRNPLM